MLSRGRNCAVWRERNGMEILWRDGRCEIVVVK
jgi:hypothetical protein